MMPASVDLAIVGGGSVGLTAAALGARAGFSIAVIEATAGPAMRTDTTPDPRAYAITTASARILDAVGVWHEVMAQSGLVETMAIEDAAGGGRIRFDAAAVGAPALCHIVPHGVLHDALTARLTSLPAIRWLRPDRIATIDHSSSGVRLRCGSGQELIARVVIGADGARSPLRELLGLAPQVSAYDQRALVATIRCDRPHRGCARQRFLATGPIAFLPLASPCDHALVWSLTTEAAQALEAVDAVAFATAIQQVALPEVGRITQVAARGAYPLISQHLATYVTEGVAFVGDAAHVIHPLAGQGLNLGLLDAAALIEVLSAAPRQRQLGARATLRRYERWRKGENRLMQLAMDGMHRLFTNETKPAIAARSIGMNAIDALGPVKRLLIRRAMGLAGDLPVVARAGSP